MSTIPSTSVIITDGNLSVRTNEEPSLDELAADVIQELEQSIQAPSDIKIIDGLMYVQNKELETEIVHQLEQLRSNLADSLDEAAEQPSLQERLTDSLKNHNMVVLWGRPLPELITAAKLISTKFKILNSLNVNCYNDHNSEVVIVNMTGTTLHYCEDGDRVISGYCSSYRLCESDTKVIYVTEDDEEAISQWKILLMSHNPFKVVRLTEAVSLKSVHEFSEL